MAEQSDTLETALWAAMVALKEKAALARRVSAQLPDREGRLAEQAKGLEQHIATLRQVLQSTVAQQAQGSRWGAARQRDDRTRAALPHR